MKNTIKLMMVVLMISIGTNSCTDNFAEINSDPNVLSEVTPELLLTGVMKSHLDLTGGDANFWMYLQYGRYAGGMSGNLMHNFGVFIGFVNSYWSRFYGNCLKPAREVQDVWGDDPDYVNRVQIAKALESWVYSVVLSTWGAVPVSEALTNSFFKIPFDSELVGYQHILGTLEKAGDIMTTTTSTDALTADPMFDGDNEQWLRFINSLRLKVALRVTGSTDPALAQLGRDHINDIVQNDMGNLIEANSDNAALFWGTNSPDDFSTMYIRTAINQSENWEPRLSDEMILWLSAYSDPRLTAFAKPAQIQLGGQVEIDSAGTAIDVVYGVPYLGTPIGGDQPYVGWDLQNIDNPLGNAVLENYSEFNDEYTKQDSEFMIISASEVKFILAEIAERGLASLPGPASTYYEDGIRLSFERYGVGGADAYLAQQGVAYNVGSEDDQVLNNWTTSSNTGILANEAIKQIVTQRWITMFFQGHDAWCLQKRTNLLPWAPFMNPGEQTNPMDYPERMVYSESDELNAPEEYATAINEFLGGNDLVTTPIAMNADKVPVDWPSFVPEWSTDFAKRWYGSSIADLEAAGLTDVTDLDPEEAQAAIANGTGYIRIQD